MATVSELAILALEDPRWTRFVDAHADATPFHLPAWALFLSECYGFPSFAAVVLSGREVVAGIPVAAVRRRRWVSLPFTDACGPLGDSELLVTALEGGRGASGVEVRAALPGVPGHVVAVGHTLALEANFPDVFARFHKSQVQRNIRRAEREGVEVRIATTEDDLVETFYGLHLRTRRRLGAPVQRKRYFSLLWRRVLDPGGGYVLLARHAGVPVAGAVFLTAGRTVVYKYGASDERSWKLRPNHALFNAAIAKSCTENRAMFDFGRTDLGDEGLCAFKRGWGAVERELVYSSVGAGVGQRRRTVNAAAAAASSVIRVSPAVVCRAAGLLYGRAA